MAEKVRYYLEQSVPELEDLKKKGLFEKSEITMIMRRRTDFEQRIQGRGSKPRDFLKYSDFELNLEKLRKKRYNRFIKAGIIDTKPTISDWAGTRRIMFIFDRATRRYPGELDIWSKYLKFAKSNGAIKVIYKVYSRLLQLQPRNIDAWLSAAKYEFETNANAKGSRILFQRGLRLNPESLNLWLEYVSFELSYITKLLVRRKVLGLITEKQQQDELETNESNLSKKLTEDDHNDEDFKQDIIELPEADEINEQLNDLPEADMNMLGNPETNPALKGDVALTIFDLCIPAIAKTFPKESTNKNEKIIAICQQFLKLFDKFDQLDQNYLYLHVLNYLQTNYPRDPATLLVDITLPIRNIDIDNPALAENLQLTVNKCMAYKLKSKDAEQTDKLISLFTEEITEKYLNKSNDEQLNNLLKAIIKKCSQ